MLFHEADKAVPLQEPLPQPLEPTPIPIGDSGVMLLSAIVGVYLVKKLRSKR